MSINIGYFARESFQNFRRNWAITLGAVITIYLSLSARRRVPRHGRHRQQRGEVRRGQGHHPDLHQGRCLDRGRQRAPAVAGRRERRLSRASPTPTRTRRWRSSSRTWRRAPRSSSSSRATRCRHRSTSRSRTRAPSSRWWPRSRPTRIFVKVADRPDNPRSRSSTVSRSSRSSSRSRACCAGSRSPS